MNIRYNNYYNTAIYIIIFTLIVPRHVKNSTCIYPYNILEL